VFWYASSIVRSRSRIATILPCWHRGRSGSRPSYPDANDAGRRRFTVARCATCEPRSLCGTDPGCWPTIRNQLGQVRIEQGKALIESCKRGGVEAYAYLI
jgi:hypothetical protein